MKNIIVLSIVFTVLTGCASSRISTIPVNARTNHPVKVIALTPGGGVLGDAIGVELSNRGFNIIDANSTSRVVGRSNMSEFEMARPENLAALRSQGIDAYLSVKGGGGYDTQPQAASARVNSAITGQTMAGASWQNGWGGMAGSIADRTMRKGFSEAAIEIADALASSLTQDNRMEPLPSTSQRLPPPDYIPNVQPLPDVAIDRQSIPTGELSPQVTRVAKQSGCQVRGTPTLIGKGPGVETYQASCESGQIALFKCEMRQCRMMN